MAMGKSYRIYEKIKSTGPHSILLEQRNYNTTLLFESQAVAVLSINETEALKSQYKKIIEAYGCLGVLQFNCDGIIFSYLVIVTGCFSVGKIYDSEIFKITQTNFIPLHHHQSSNDDRISELRKVLNSGTFYFSWSSGTCQALDITLSAERSFLSNCTDNRFFWNRLLHAHLVRYGVDTENWLMKVMCGNIEMRTVYVGHRQARAVLISRLSCERAGTRFNVRGTNDDGHVANFVETEQLIYLENEITSHIQTRGSVPIFWEQPGIQVGSHKIKISRGFEVSAPAFNRHFKLLKKLYGKQLIVNLLGSNLIGNKEGEAMLSQIFQSQLSNSEHADIPHVLFDYHQECRGGNTKNVSKLEAKTKSYLEDFSFFHAIDNQVARSQNGAIRTNCLDCLDRTNCVQTYFGLEILKEQLITLKLNDKAQIFSRFEEVFRQMWINNGNEISKIYAGTGAIQGNSKLIDGARSAARTIQNNLLDSTKQEAIDILLLGTTLNPDISDKIHRLLPTDMLHIPPYILEEMCKRRKEYVEKRRIRIAVGTYNVNGGKHFRSVVYKDVSLSDWLLDAPEQSSVSTPEKENCKMHPVDVFAIGFQEIVDLNATNIVAASSDNAKAWAEELQKVISRDEEYVLVTYQQLVGVCLYIFVRPVYAPFIRDVAIDCVKTGLGGATGNKGAVAIRLVLFSTSFCFICAHFAAGQSQVSERNADYTEITKKINFPLNKTLDAHDYVFWCGDFNYRVDYDKEEMRELLKQNEISHLLQFDQLRIQKEQGNTFKNFIEGPINFFPTYKYDLFSDDYDTSEKCRQPAWTDRVLWKSRDFMEGPECDADWNPGELVFYGRAELKQSDHRPVIAWVDVLVDSINEEMRNQVFGNVIRELGPPDGTVLIQMKADPNIENTLEDQFMDVLIRDLSEIGEILLIRYVGDTIWVTFKTGHSALTAVERGVINIGHRSLELKFKTPNWVTLIEKEIDRLRLVDKSLEYGSVSPSNDMHSTVRESGGSNIQKLPPPRPVPPVKLSSDSENRPGISIPNQEYESSLSKFSQLTCSEIPEQVETTMNPPPLPARQFPLPPPQMPPPVLSTTQPPPIPSRTQPAQAPPSLPLSSIPTQPPPIPPRAQGTDQAEHGSPRRHLG